MEKKIPGKAWEYLVYNKLDQLVLSQDGLQRVANQWSFTKYDALGRVVITGLYNHGAVLLQAGMQNLVSLHGQSNSLFESRVSTGKGYNNASFPQSIAYYHSINYYDNYDFPGNVFGQPNTSLGQAPSGRTKGLLTASAITVLGTGNMLQTVNYYDDKAQIVQSKSQHYKGGVVNAGNYDEVSTTYKFTGEVETSIRKHYTGGSTESLYVYNEFLYDKMGRKTGTKQRTGDNAGTSNPLILLSGNVYNEVGQLRQKSFHAANPASPVFAKTVTYNYNERGWLSSQEAPSMFSQYLKYNEEN